MIGALQSLLARLGFALVLAGLAVWSGLTSIDRVDTAAIARSSDAAFRARMAAGLPDTASYLWYEAVTDRALTLEEPDLSLSIAAFERALRQEPRDGEEWGRFAYALYLDGTDLDGAVRALAQSYEHMPIGSWEYRKWRLQFVEILWPDLPEGLRNRAAYEALAEEEDWVADRAPSVRERLQSAAGL